MRTFLALFSILFLFLSCDLSKNKQSNINNVKFNRPSNTKSASNRQSNKRSASNKPSNTQYTQQVPVQIYKNFMGEVANYTPATMLRVPPALLNLSYRALDCLDTDSEADIQEKYDTFSQSADINEMNLARAAAGLAPLSREEEDTMNQDLYVFDLAFEIIKRSRGWS